MSARSIRGERGQTLVFTVLFLSVLIGMAGLVIDVGAWYVQREKAQAAADMGALAAASELPDSGSSVTAGEDYVDRNLSGATPEVNPVYDGDPSKVEVRARTHGETFFLGLFGFDTVGISARAVAQKYSGAVPLAIFVYDEECDAFGLGMNGNDHTINGGIHSNGHFKVNGNDITVGGATAGGPNGCDPEVNGARIKFGEGDEPMLEEEFLEWPAYFTQSEFACDYSRRTFQFNTRGMTIPSGVYCATEKFVANGDDISGNITVLAPEIQVDGNHQRFTPYAKDLLFFGTGTKELVLNGDGFEWEGIIFCPACRVKIDGNQDSVLRGMIEGYHVEVNGNGFTMQGTGEMTQDFIGLIE
jgi:Putative Flp pilus-assembly TadE/G-like